MVFFYFSIFIINIRWEGRWIGSCKLILTLWFTHCISELEPWCVWWRLVLEHHKTCVYRAPRCSSMHPFSITLTPCCSSPRWLCLLSYMCHFWLPLFIYFFPTREAANIALAQIRAKSFMKQTYIKEHVLLLGFPVSPRTSSCKPHRAY